MALALHWQHCMRLNQARYDIAFVHSFSDVVSWANGNHLVCNKTRCRLPDVSQLNKNRKTNIDQDSNRLLSFHSLFNQVGPYQTHRDIEKEYTQTQKQFRHLSSCCWASASSLAAADFLALTALPGTSLFTGASLPLLSLLSLLLSPVDWELQWRILKQSTTKTDKANKQPSNELMNESTRDVKFVYFLNSNFDC